MSVPEGSILKSIADCDRRIADADRELERLRGRRAARWQEQDQRPRDQNVAGEVGGDPGKGAAGHAAGRISTLTDGARGFLAGPPVGLLTHVGTGLHPWEWNSTGLLPYRQQRQVLIPRHRRDRCPCQAEAGKCERLDVHHCSTLRTLAPPSHRAVVGSIYG
jgi:hypothetical protein